MIEKLKMQTTNMVDENVKKIGKLFPNCLTEKLDENGKPEVAIDFDQIRQELSKDIVEGTEERYQFTWPDKRNAIRLANTPTTDTLRPCREESVDFDKTQNLYIEGDNLEVLKLLRENYLGKIKMIYIDPPYNTGNDFVYNDDFAQNESEYIHNSGQEDVDGLRLVANTENNGRFHTDWLNMMYPRLKVAKDLLSENGVIFISIDDHEIESLRKLCDEVFGERNFIAQFIWKSRQNKDNRNLTGVSIDHEYIVCFAKNANIRAVKGSERKTDQYKNPDNDPRGPWTSANMAGLLSADLRPNCHYDLINPETGINYGRPQMGWRYDKNTMARLIEEKRIIWPDNPDGRPRKKSFLSELTEILPGFSSIVGVDIYTRNATIEVEKLFGNRYFDFPKPLLLIKDFIQQSTEDNSLVLDFFSGSATTAHAVMQLNTEDGGNRKFIMVQLPEATDEKSEAYKAGYKNICEIGKERIRRAGKKILEEQKAKQGNLFSDEQKNIDVGFRVLKLDSSNMQDVYYTPSEFTENDLFADNIKGDRLANDCEDLLFQAMIELGIELSAKIEKKSIAGKAVWIVNKGYLMACFDKDVNETTITEISKLQPYYFVMRDSSMSTDNVADNFEQIWEEYSKDTVRRIL